VQDDDHSYLDLPFLIILKKHEVDLNIGYGIAYGRSVFRFGFVLLFRFDSVNYTYYVDYIQMVLIDDVLNPYELA